MLARKNHDTLPFDPLAERIARRTHRERKRIRLSDEHFSAFIRGAASGCLGHPAAAWLLIPLAIAAYVAVLTVWYTLVVCLEVLTGKARRSPKKKKSARRVKTHFHEV